MDKKTQGSVRQEIEDRRDRALVKKLLNGDKRAFEQLYNLHSKRVYGLCYKICGNPDDAADSVHESFVTVIRRLPSLDIDQFSFGGYLLVSARNTCIKERRRNVKLQPTAELQEYRKATDPVDIERDPERSLLLSEQRRRVRFASDRLAPRQRRALALRELEDLSYTEIASQLGLKDNAVAQLISRARLRLKEEIRSTSCEKTVGTNCSKALPLLSKQIDGELGGDQRRWLDRHLARCRSCRASLEDLQEAGAMYRSFAPAFASAEIARRILEDEALAHLFNGRLVSRHIKRTTSSSGKRLLMATTAACVAVVLTAISAGIGIDWTSGSQSGFERQANAGGGSRLVGDRGLFNDLVFHQPGTITVSGMTTLVEDRPGLEKDESGSTLNTVAGRKSGDAVIAGRTRPPGSLRRHRSRRSLKGRRKISRARADIRDRQDKKHSPRVAKKIKSGINSGQHGTVSAGERKEENTGTTAKSTSSSADNGAVSDSSEPGSVSESKVAPKISLEPATPKKVPGPGSYDGEKIAKAISGVDKLPDGPSWQLPH